MARRWPSESAIEGVGRGIEKEQLLTNLFLENVNLGECGGGRQLNPGERSMPGSADAKLRGRWTAEVRRSVKNAFVCEVIVLPSRRAKR